MRRTRSRTRTAAAVLLWLLTPHGALATALTTGRFDYVDVKLTPNSPDILTDIE